MTNIESELTCRDHSGGVIEVQLGNAPQNSLTVPFLMDVTQLIRELDASEHCKAILFTSPFQDFCVGVTEAEAASLDRNGQAALHAALNEAMLALYACETPMLCALRGRTLAEGLMFLLASDIRIAHARAAIEFSQIKLGRGYPEILMAVARASMDSNTQRRLMLTGQRLGPIAARTAHLIEIIADDMGDLQEYALKEAQKLAALPQDAFVAIKKELRAETVEHIFRLNSGVSIEERGQTEMGEIPNPIRKSA